MASTGLRVVLVTAALWALWRELHGLSVDALAEQLRTFGWARIGLGLAATTISFLLLGLLEMLALRQTDDATGDHVPVGTALRTGLVANALSQSIGLSVLTGAAVRSRAYVRYGLDAASVAQVTAFVTIGATLGLLATAAVALFTVSSASIHAGLSLAARPTGALLASIVIGYVAWGYGGRGAMIGRGRWRIARPAPTLALGQIALAMADWIITGAVLYAFMPSGENLTIGLVLGTYVIAQVAGVTSHVPAGAGVFEFVVLALLVQAEPQAPREHIAAALVMFRLTYYLAPLCVAIAMVAGESLGRRSGVLQPGKVPFIRVREAEVRRVG